MLVAQRVVRIAREEQELRNFQLQHRGAEVVHDLAFGCAEFVVRELVGLLILYNGHTFLKK